MLREGGWGSRWARLIQVCFLLVWVAKDIVRIARVLEMKQQNVKLLLKYTTDCGNKSSNQA